MATIGIDQSEGQERLDEAKGVEAFQGYRPTGEENRPAFERTSYRPRVVPVHRLLELWAIHEGGSLKRIVMDRPSDGDEYGIDEAREAWEWVALTPGWSKVVHEVMKHLILRNRTWAQWPKEPAVRTERLMFGRSDGTCWSELVQFCDWPFISYEAAGRAWVPFLKALQKRCVDKPFCLNEQYFESR